MFWTACPYGFRPEQAESIWKGRNRQSGQLFFAPDFQLLIDRETFILEKRILKNSLLWVDIDQAGSYELPQGRLSLTYDAGPCLRNGRTEGRKRWSAPRTLVSPPLQALGAGRFSVSLGDERKRKSSGYLTDNKIDRFAKDRALVLENGDGRIIWLIGYRLDERFKLNKDNEQPFWRITYSGIS
ncbi:MAG: hypothetical protein IPN20_05060 [Haliscomenobacter sp.]|nr:hypothetical protein [Haliscomenobacter sp.]